MSQAQFSLAGTPHRARAEHLSRRFPMTAFETPVLPMRRSGMLLGSFRSDKHQLFHRDDGGWRSASQEEA